MENIIIIALIAIGATLGIYSAVKHFKGQGGCCGGSSYKPRQKKLSQVRYQKTFTVNGMHCEHCKRRVEEVINDVPSLSGKVDLKAGKVVISYADSVEDAVIIERLKRVGYTEAEVEEIKNKG